MGPSLVAIRLGVRQACFVSSRCNVYRHPSSKQILRRLSIAHAVLPDLDTFPRRHIGPSDKDLPVMLATLSPPVSSLDEFVSQVVPTDVASYPDLSSLNMAGVDSKPLKMGDGLSESKLTRAGQELAEQNVQLRYLQGLGYYGTHTPSVIKRNMLENPAWYTSYTPYQPEISQGRLECLLNFQTMVADLTKLPMANASLLDEGTAAAEAMSMSLAALPPNRSKREKRTYVVDKGVFPNTISVLRSRAEGLGIRILTVDLEEMMNAKAKLLDDLAQDLVGVLVQYPDKAGKIRDYKQLAKTVHAHHALLTVAADILALTILTPPGELGADIAVGSTQRFGIPLGNGGPHAAFLAAREEHKRRLPGRLVGVTKDRLGNRALRLSLQTREQHIRRERATSNVCTAQALLANMAAMYAVYHGPDGLRAIAEKVVKTAAVVEGALEAYGFDVVGGAQFGSVRARFVDERLLAEIKTALLEEHISVRLDRGGGGVLCLQMFFDETTDGDFIEKLVAIFQRFASQGGDKDINHIIDATTIDKLAEVAIPSTLRRTSSYLTHPIFNTYHSETELTRYIYHLQSKDLSLVHSMIPLGSCTMKLNAATEMQFLSHPGFANIAPNLGPQQDPGYATITSQLCRQLAAITGMDAVSLQPNSGAQGEFAGLRVIRKYHESRPGPKRDICLIPVSAHGTNPASAAMAGMRVVPINCDKKTGNLDIVDLEAKCRQYQDTLGAMMITYPSTFGVFEPGIRRVCELVHQSGGLVYMDGANMNAQIGLCSPGDIGADVCHLNLHKTFCIPHGGGGPGVGPICVKEHLAEYLPGQDPGAHHPMVASAPYGSASILTISWAYNRLMGGNGLRRATTMALLNANYLLSRLRPHYTILYTNQYSRCAHEFILDVRQLRETAGIEAIDIAKRLQDYGFHAPTMSWPVAGTLMIEPTESESLEELDRFVDALVSIRGEIREIENGRYSKEINVLTEAPHPLADLLGPDETWQRKKYSREKAAWPLPWLRERKFWPSVARVDDNLGDRNLICTCPPVEDTTSD